MRIRQGATATGYDVNARKRAVNLTLNEDLVNRVRDIADNLSGVVESLLAGYVDQAERERRDRAQAIESAVETWNRFASDHGSFADEHSTL
ncbi:MAG: type II toxin-antitoxin system CcdA family antitoxin [Proteobacteria bacterium]|nr:type II toxin-antitoxin system CcdA family antitoxin [Pseudomonadota bacterium]